MFTRKCLHIVLASVLFTVLQVTPTSNAYSPSNTESLYIYAVFDAPIDQPQGYIEIQNPHLLPSLQVPQAAYQATSGTTAYTELDTLVVIYPNTAAGTLSAGDVSLIQQHVVDSAKFIWRQSHLKFHLNLTFMVINDYKDSSEFTQHQNGGYWLNPTDDDGDGISIESDLLNRGVVRDQFDSINYLWAHNNGSLPAAYGGLGGAIYWQLGLTGITENPIFQLSGTESFSTAFPHEIQHTIDFMLESSGYPEYFFADRPWDLAGAFGENWSFWAYGMKIWPTNNWLVLRSPWGDIIQIPDVDEDGVPDQGSSLPITEQSLNSSTALVDSDGDGYGDLNESVAGFFKNADLAAPDTDGDKALDGNDFEPLYDISTQILEKTLPLNGNPASWDKLTSSINASNAPFSYTIYTNWDSNYLYLMMQIDKYAGIRLMIDASADGWFHGKDNYEISIDPSYSNPTDPFIIGKAHILDSSETIIAAKGYPMWDDDPSYPFGRLITESQFGRYARSYGSGYLIQIAIPYNPQTGLIPQHGKRVGLNFTFNNIDRQPNLWAETFEKDNLVDVTLWGNIFFPPGYCDLFETSMLDLRWLWIDPLADSTYSLTANPGNLRLMTPASGHDLFFNLNAPRVLQPVGRKFVVQTRVSIAPVPDEYQGAGLLIWQDGNNNIRLELKTGGHLRFIYRVGGTYTDSGDIVLSASDMYLKLERDNNNFTAKYSRTGMDWTQVGSVNFSAANTLYAGVHLINEWQENPLQADFDFIAFNWCANPTYKNYLPMIIR